MERAFHDKGLRVCSFDRTLIAIIIGILFFLIAMPMAFRLSNTLGGFVGVKTLNKNSPTLLGMLIHVIIFTLIIRLLMW
ncbi:MAG: hypothetical protein ABIW84_06265 [Ilumatobacteraceae bacterium]